MVSEARQKRLAETQYRDMPPGCAAGMQYSEQNDVHRRKTGPGNFH